MKTILKNMVFAAVTMITVPLCAQPNWQVNENDFSQFMNFTGQLRFDGVYSEDPNDMIGAFVDGQVRGVASPQFVESDSAWYAFLKVHSNVSAGEVVELRLWDADADSIHMAANDYDFSANSSIGVVGQPEILGTNNFPVGLSFAPALLAENRGSAASYGMFSNEDVDSGQSHTYHLLGGDNDGQWFAIEGDSLYSIGNLSFETQVDYTIWVEVRDGKGGYYIDTFTFSITDQNDQVQLTNLDLELLENTPAGTVVHELGIEDEDAEPVYAFSIISGNELGVFAIDSANGDVLIADPLNLDFEEHSAFEITIEVIDQGSPTHKTVEVLKVRVVDTEEDQLSASPIVTANGDDFNDTWEVDDITIYKNHTLSIFNEHMVKVYEVVGYQNDWAGQRSDGSFLSAGTYYYVMHLNDQRFSGVINLFY